MELVVNTDISASTKREPTIRKPAYRIYRVIDRNPTFSTIVSNFNRRENLTIPVTILSSVLCVAVNHRAGFNPGNKSLAIFAPAASMIYGFGHAVRNSADRLMGFLPKDDEVPIFNKPKIEKSNQSIFLNHTPSYPVVSDGEITANSLAVSTMFAVIAAHPDVCGRFRIRTLVTTGLVFGATYAYMNSTLRYLCRYKHDKMNTEYPVIDHNPDFSKVVGNFNTRDYLRVSASTAYTLIAGYHFGAKRIVGCWVMAGLLGLVFGFENSYMESSCRLMGVFLNDDEVAKFNKK